MDHHVNLKVLSEGEMEYFEPYLDEADFLS
jgi:hypothetical protein